MSKLFNLKEWLTIPETAQHLSIVFGEEVSEADVLRLALDRRLQLSVYFVNQTYARRGTLTSYEKASRRDEDIPPDLAELLNKIPDEELGAYIDGLQAFSEDSKGFHNLSDQVKSIHGIWDLSMMGYGRIEIEHRYQQLTGGPVLTLECLDGTYVERQDGTICELQESFDNNEYQTGSTAAGRKLNEYISANNIEEHEAQALLDQHKQERDEYLEKWRTQDHSRDYFPAACLPQDSVLVVRTQALRELEYSLSEEDNRQTDQDLLPESERKSLLKLALGMAVAAYGYTPGANRNPATGNNTGSITVDLEKHGLSLDSDTIRKFIKEAEEQFGVLLP